MARMPHSDLTSAETLDRTLPELDVPPAGDVVPVHIGLREFRELGTVETIDELSSPEPASGGGINWLFLVTFVLPVLLGGIYLFFIAADRYESEVRFIVRSTDGGGISMDASSSLAGASLSRAGEDAYIVNEYIVSRDALDRLVREKDLAGIFSRPEADMLSRFPPLIGRSSRESLFKYYKSMVQTWVDTSTGISTIDVTAFRPEDAKLLAATLLGYAESVVNHINDRADKDRVTYAEQILAQSKDSLAAVERRITDFRTSAGTIDPSREYAAALQNIGRLSTEVSQEEAALAQQVAMTPNAPGIANFRSKVKAMRDEIARENAKITGGAASLAPKFATYDQLNLEREIAAKEIGTAETNLEMARSEAGRQRLYLQPVVEPNLPDRPESPKRILDFIILVVASGAAYATLRQLKQLAEEHVA